MSAIDDALRANESYAAGFSGGELPSPPAKRLAVVACMDARIDPIRALGLKPGDAHVIRNAGGIVTEDTLRSLILSHHLLGTREFLIINHTDCGMVTFRDRELRERLERETRAKPEAPSAFLAFDDLDENVRAQIRAAQSHPWIPRSVIVRGFVFDVRTGKLREVSAEPAARRTAG